jgi:hypothetical protein
MYLYYTRKRIGENGQTYGEEAKSGGVYILGNVDGVLRVEADFACSHLHQTYSGSRPEAISSGSINQGVIKSENFYINPFFYVKLLGVHTHPSCLIRK